MVQERLSGLSIGRKSAGQKASTANGLLNTGSLDRTHIQSGYSSETGYVQVRASEPTAHTFSPALSPYQALTACGFRTDPGGLMTTTGYTVYREHIKEHAVPGKPLGLSLIHISEPTRH